VVGKFIVHKDLPQHLAQGMFAQPGSYDMIMRYSSLTPKLVPDNIPGKSTSVRLLLSYSLPILTLPFGLHHILSQLLLLSYASLLYLEAVP
jgi:hypothetical protein